MGKVDAMIRELIQLVESELKVTLPKDSAPRIKAALCEAYGGERVYIERLPKLIHQVRIQALGTGMSGAALASGLGLSVRQVRRITRGR